MPFSLKEPKQTGVIRHPLFPELFVEVEKPTIKALVDWGEVVAGYNPAPVAAINPDNKRAILGLGGKVRQLQQSAQVPLDVTLDFLIRHVKNIGGFDEPYGKGNAKEMLTRLIDDQFNFTEKRQVAILDPETGDDTGRTQEKEVKTNFYAHVSERIVSQETYDPLVKTSSQPASES